MIPLSEQHITTIKEAAKKLTGAKRRAFQAQVAMDYMNSKPYLAEKPLVGIARRLRWD
jgi:hypothetical protein